MAEKRPIQDLMGVTMEKMREMVDVQTIIGDPIVVSDKVTIVPVSKVSTGATLTSFPFSSSKSGHSSSLTSE